MIENMIDGNLKQARKQAKNYSFEKIVLTLHDEWCYSLAKAAMSAIWLKSGECYQLACDTE